MLIVLGLIFAWGCYLFYVKVLNNNNSSQQVNPTNQYMVEDDGVYEDDTYIEYQEYEEEEEQEDIDFEYQNQDFYDDASYDTDSYDTHDTMYEDTYRSFFSEEERY